MQKSLIDRVRDLQKDLDDVKDFNTLLYFHVFLLAWAERVQEQMFKANARRHQ